MNLIETLGNIFQKGIEITQKAVEVTHTASEMLLDAAAVVIIKKGEEELKKTCARSRRNLVISAILNGVMLLAAVLIAFFLRELETWGILAIALINYVILGRAVFNILRFTRTIILPYRELIMLLIPAFPGELRKRKSFEGAVKETIRAAVRYYVAKAPEIAQKIHGAGSILGAFPSLGEIENKAAADFYPLVCRLLRVILLYNILLFTFCYGLLVFIVKRFIIGTMLGMSFIGLYTYPFVFIMGIIKT
jgi:hypothetical protein